MCPLVIGSWIHTDDAVLITNMSANGDTSFFMDNGEWNLLEMPFMKHTMVYLCCPEPFTDLTFWIVVKRKPLYYVFNLIMPSIFLTATTLLTFILPVESGEKVSLGVTMLLALTVFLLIVAETMPTTSKNIPLIGKKLFLTIYLWIAP